MQCTGNLPHEVRTIVRISVLSVIPTPLFFDPALPWTPSRSRRLRTEDARAMALTDDIPARAAARAVPLFCRLSIEAACTEAVRRRRRIGRGESHSGVQ